MFSSPPAGCTPRSPDAELIAAKRAARRPGLRFLKPETPGQRGQAPYPKVTQRESWQETSRLPASPPPFPRARRPRVSAALRGRPGSGLPRAAGGGARGGGRGESAVVDAPRGRQRRRRRRKLSRAAAAEPAGLGRAPWVACTALRTQCPRPWAATCSS